MHLRFLLFFAALILPFTAAHSQDREVPYWATLRANEVNLRVGPSEDYRIDWVYRRKGMPVKVIRVLEGWRLIEDPDGARGWVVSRLLSPDLGVMVTGKNPAPMREDADLNAAIKWRLEPGVVGTLRDCSDNWCEITVGARRGYVQQDQLWGAGEP